MSKLYSRAGIGILFAAFLFVILLSQTLFKSIRIDLTENNLYSVSEGTENILDDLDEPITFYYFFSKKASESQPSIRTYAQRVEELLQEYVLLSGEKIKLQVIDPEPFSEDEDRASQFGLQPIGKNTTGDDIYFGLVGTNSVDDKELIPYFHPEKESLLEYDISKLVYRLSLDKKPMIGLIDGVSANGGLDPMARQPKQPWFVLQQINDLFTVKTIEKDATEIDESINTLMLIQPKGLSDSALYAIDQFVMRGGKLIVFTDPNAFVDRMPASQQNPFPQSMPGQDLNNLFNAWGFTVDMDNVVLDADLAMYLNVGGRATRHPAVLSFNEQRLDQEALMTQGLESINIHSAGSISLVKHESKTEDEDNTESNHNDSDKSEYTIAEKIESQSKASDISLHPVIRSSQNSMLVNKARLAFLPDPSELSKDFIADANEYIIGARIDGQFVSAFNDKVPEGKKDQHLSESTNKGNIFVIADIDLLADMMWVQVQQVFGQSFAQAFADNGDFIYNVVDIMSGSSDLIGLRGRGRYSRPFEVVQNLRARAEMQFLHKEQELQQQLQETERQLSELQATVNEQGKIVLSDEQEQAIENFQSQKLKIRKDLRNVRHQLDKDIEKLGSYLALINMFLIPGVLIVLALLIALSRRRWQAKLIAKQQEHR